MYFFISRSAVTGLEGISDYVVLVTPDNSNPISINVDPKILIPDLENQIQNTKNNFLFQSMIATGIIILLSSICTWFVTRRALTSLTGFYSLQKIPRPACLEILFLSISSQPGHILHLKFIICHLRYSSELLL